VAPTESDREQTVDGGVDVALEICPAIEGELVSEPTIELDDRVEAEVLDVTIGG
jgi:hypothetical protein